MDELTAGAGSIVIGIAVGCALAALAVRSPALRWCTAVLVLLAWLAMSTLAPAVAAVLHLARGDLGIGLLCVALAAGLGWLWVLLGWPPLRRYWTLRRQWATGWE